VRRQRHRAEPSHTSRPQNKSTTLTAAPTATRLIRLPFSLGGAVRRVLGRSRTEVLFAITTFVSAGLLFIVEPMFAKMVVPLLGGAPAVWNTCLVFYQAALLLGYLYAHLSLTWLGPRRQAVLHLIFLCLPWTVLPIGVAEGWLPPPDAFPVFWLWMLLTVSVGLPFLVVSSSAPVFQAWFSHTESRSARDPYFLYAASNFGSLLALLGYPLVIESHWTLKEQAWQWAVGYGLLMILAAVCASQLWRSSPVDVAEGQEGAEDSEEGLDTQRPTFRRRLHWLALSLVPSSLLLGVTTYISTDIAQIPLLWVIPLALYLLTFVLVFARRQVLRLSWMVRIEPYAILAAVAALASSVETPAKLLLIGVLQLLVFVVIAMVCHGQLAADRPARRHLTEFYLWMSLGGVLGGLFNALAAPLLFPGAWEYPLMLVVACLLQPQPAESRRILRSMAPKFVLPAVVLVACGGLTWMLRLQMKPLEWSYANTGTAKAMLVLSAAAVAFFLRRHPAMFTTGIAAVLGIAFAYPCELTEALHRERSFFGVIRVVKDPVWNAHHLYHGSTTHGCQSLDPVERREPWTYYSRKGPLGRIFQIVRSRRPTANIGVLGLGTGTIAAYGQPGDSITFYDIDPAVERIARNPDYFTYLTDCRAKWNVILGDARLSLVHGPARQFDLLVVDVFTSDTVPIHLINRESLQIYLDRLAGHGLLAIHISNRFLDLGPILGKLAEDAGVPTLIGDDNVPESGYAHVGSTWVVMAREVDDLEALAVDSNWRPTQVAEGRVWTDDFSNVLSAVERNVSWDWLQPSVWCKAAESEADFYSSLGGAFLQQERWEEATSQLQKAIELKPDDADAHNNLGVVLGRRNRYDEALAHYRKAVELQPDHAEAQHNLGLVLQDFGNLDEAIVHYRKAVQVAPDLVEARDDLVVALTDHGELDEALQHSQKVLDLRPDFAQGHDHCGFLLHKKGRIDEAIVHYRNALKIDPNNAEAHAHLAMALQDRREFAEAIAHYREAVRTVPNHATAVNNLAWMLATCPEASVRNGAEAVELARRAIKLAQDGDPSDLDTLAAAYAEVGSFAEAVETARKALDLAKKQGDREMAESIQKRILLYEAKTPFREAPALSNARPAQLPAKQK
jgi:tetratricopeptide (TPR) repeat protein/spermidine synthase